MDEEKLKLKKLQEEQKANSKKKELLNSYIESSKNFDDKVYRVNIPNAEYLEKKIDSEEIPVEFIRSENWMETIVTMSSILLMMAIFLSLRRNVTGFTNLMQIEKSGIVMKNIDIK